MSQTADLTITQPKGRFPMISKMSSMFLIVVASLVFISQPLLADSRYITCNSRDSQYEYCRVHTEDNVRLSRQLSSSECIEGRTWGYDRHGVWVDRGCRAEFAVGRSGYREYNNSGYGDNNHHRERSRGEYRDHSSRDYGNIPGWIIGNFNGKNERDQSAVSISVKRNGDVVARWAGQEHTGYFDGRNLRIGDRDFIVKQRRNGFETILREDKGNRVIFRRPR